jgi:prevent-host-death family protein
MRGVGGRLYGRGDADRRHLMYTFQTVKRTHTRTETSLEVGVRDLRAQLAHWLSVAREREVVITDRGRPIARLLPVGVAPGLQALIDAGTVTAPTRPATPLERPLHSRGTVSDLIDRR